MAKLLTALRLYVLVYIMLSYTELAVVSIIASSYMK